MKLLYMTSNLPASTKGYIKFFDAFFITIAIGYVLQNLLPLLPEKMATFYPSFLRVRHKYLFLPAVMGILYIVITNQMERRGKFNAEKAHAILFGLIRFWLAAGIASYGFAKILGTQFSGANNVAARDTLIGDFSGNYLTYYYFNFSHPYVLLIGYLQIGGALLLLFRRTTLLAIFLLLPVLANIVMIDLFYGIPPTPTVMAIVFTAALIYLLLLHAPQLINLFFKTVYALPKAGNRTFNNLLRIAVVAFSFFIIYYDLQENRYTSKTGDPAILGKWRIEQSSVNGKEIRVNAWQTDSSAWAAIYFYNAEYCAIGSNPYYYDRTKTNIGEYDFDAIKHSLNIYFYNTRDSLHALVGMPTTNTMLVKGLLGKDSVILELRRVKM